MRSKSCINAVLLCSLVPLVVASAQLTVGQASATNGSQLSSSNKDVIGELFQQLKDAHLRELNAAAEDHKRELGAAAEGHKRELGAAAEAQQRELSAAAVELRAAQDQIDVLRQENVRLTRQMGQLRYEADKWKSLASPNCFTLLAKIKERSEVLAERNNDDEYEISDLERRHRQAELAITRTKSRLSAWEDALTRITTEYRQHQEIVRRIRKGSRQAASYDFNGTEHRLPEGENTSDRMADLRKQIQSITKEVEEAKSNYGSREHEFKRLDEELSSSKEEQLRRRTQCKRLEESYDQFLMDTSRPRKTK